MNLVVNEFTHSDYEKCDSWTSPCFKNGRKELVGDKNLFSKSTFMCRKRMLEEGWCLNCSRTFLNRNLILGFIVSFSYTMLYIVLYCEII